MSNTHTASPNASEASVHHLPPASEVVAGLLELVAYPDALAEIEPREFDGLPIIQTREALLREHVRRAWMMLLIGTARAGGLDDDQLGEFVYRMCGRCPAISEVQHAAIAVIEEIEAESVGLVVIPREYGDWEASRAEG